MNQLIIIGNGFDLAHGLKTSYKDFILDLLSAKASNPKGHKINKEKDLVALNNVYSYSIPLITFNTFKEYKDHIEKYGMIELYNPFFEKTLEYDEMYSKIEDFDENELTRNMKSFYYLRSSNYQSLFDFLDEGEFNVNIMGHSCGISDRVLFNSIFQHNNLNEILIYYHKWGESNKDNDFFEITQNISRYFDISSKHRMRTKIVPFTKCSTLTSYK